MFFKGSRYEKVPEATTTDAQGRTVRYKRIRMLGEPKPLTTHVVQQWERLDHIAYRYYRDPERFWRICDANRAMWPDDLVAEPGSSILIPPSEG